ncbi:hypothetical protein OAF98_03840 [Planctomicrobium sp.]|nr:hypothetical protein [Planctomicrobium sp.]MDB4731516.1 hypothetical protein [bacterium]MDB4743595.1 hypothetical protein [Planctomicrobium sp.]
MSSTKRSHDFWSRQNLIADAPLSIREKWTMQVIFLFTGDSDEGVCFASNEAIQARLSLGASQTSALLSVLRKKNLITNKRTQIGANLRTINWQVLEDLVNPNLLRNEFGKSEKPEEGTSGLSDDTSGKSELVNPDARNPTYRTSNKHPKEHPKGHFRPEEVRMPETLSVPGFQSAWMEWCSYRRESKKPISKRAAHLQIAQLSKVGPDAAVAAIQKSILNDWQGLFPSDNIKGETTNASYSRTNSGQVFDERTRNEIAVV